MEGGVGAECLPALLPWEQNAYQLCCRGNKMLTSSAGKLFAPMPPSVYGGVRGAYMIAIAVFCLPVCWCLSSTTSSYDTIKFST